MADKYVVLKVEDFEEFESIYFDSAPHVMDGTGIEVERALTRLRERILPDAVVIRRQDVFSPPALDAYSNNIQTSVEAMKMGKGGYNDRLVTRLTEIADYFHEQAALAWDTNRKLPD